MQSKLHGNMVHHGIELLLLVSMFFMLAIHKSLLLILIIKNKWGTNSLCCFSLRCTPGCLGCSVIFNTSKEALTQSLLFFATAVWLASL